MVIGSDKTNKKSFITWGFNPKVSAKKILTFLYKIVREHFKNATIERAILHHTPKDRIPVQYSSSIDIMNNVHLLQNVI